MSPRTIFLSKLLGLYCILFAVAMLLNNASITQDITELAHNSPVMLVVGVFTLFAGLAMVLAHNLWRGGALPIIVTLLGWLTLLKALLILFLPMTVQSTFPLVLLHSTALFYVRLALTLLLGLYLTYSGFAASSNRRA